jgi:hypothetical protein
MKRAAVENERFGAAQLKPTGELSFDVSLVSQER